MEQVYAPGKGDKTGQLEKQREDNRRFQKIPEQPQRERVFCLGEFLCKKNQWQKHGVHADKGQDVQQ